MENLGAFNIERDIVRLVTELVKDQPVTNSNGPHVMTSQTTGNKENQTPHSKSLFPDFLSDGRKIIVHYYRPQWWTLVQ